MSKLLNRRETTGREYIELGEQGVHRMIDVLNWQIVKLQRQIVELEHDCAHPPIGWEKQRKAYLQDQMIQNEVASAKFTLEIYGSEFQPEGHQFPTHFLQNSDQQ